MTDTDKRIQEIRERCEKATPGEWRWFSTPMFGGKELPAAPAENRLIRVESHFGTKAEEVMRFPCPDPCGLRSVDADFIEHSRTDIPFLLDEITRLRAEVEELRKEYEG